MIFRGWWGILAGIGGLLILGVLFFPARIPSLPAPRENPLTFDEALQAFEGHQKDDVERLNEVCSPKILHHGGPTSRVYVLLHGLSNCPAQFQNMARALHVAGHNVIVPRMPHHGLADRLNEEYGRLTLQELATWLGGNLEVARGLGREITVVGLSAGAEFALWVAAERSDVSRVVALNPFLAPKGLPLFLERPVGNLASRLPNLFLWWDPVAKQDYAGSPQSYPRFPTRVVGRLMVLGVHLRSQFAKQTPAVRRIQIVTSESDGTVSHAAIRILAKKISRWREIQFQETWLPKALGLPHDMVDPQNPREKIEVSDPILLKILEG